MKKLSIRPIELRDVETIYRFRTDEEVMFWGSGGYGNAIPTLSSLEEAVKKQTPLDSSRVFVIEVEETDGPLVIGMISFRDFDRVSRGAIIGMLIGNKNYWGQGYGTEAVRQFVKLLFGRYNLHRITLDTFADNKRAIRCYEKCGFVIEGVQRQAMWTMNGFRDKVLMGLLQEDWRAQQTEPFYL